MLPYGPAHEIQVSIAPGMSSGEIAGLLSKTNLIQSPVLFRIITKLAKIDNKLKAGTYKLSPRMGVFGIVEALAKGKVELVRFTIPEGASIEDITKLLGEKNLISQERFLSLVKGEDQDFKIIKSGIEFSGNLEGYLFPDTYSVEHNTGEETIIAMMIEKFAQTVIPEWLRSDVDEKVKTLDLHEIVTLASIIEKEAKFAEDKPLIASVFYNRLESKMPLQSCATVQFALDSRKSRLSLDDIKIDSPYNTYIISGLPPGPIASPGLASIQAALAPANSDYLFFAANQEGGHIFSKTFKEHQKATAQMHAQFHD